MNNFFNIPSGKNIPDDIYVIIEIPFNTCNIKYEINKKYNNIWIDRFIKNPISYPFNYGYINKSLSLDNDPLDVMVISEFPFFIGSVIHCRPIGVLKMEDESGKDYKILSVPNYTITNKYNNYNDICDVPNILLDKIFYFFKHYKDMEYNKWTRIDNWYDIHEAKKIIFNSIKLFNKLK